jgi:hypothetical protein
MTRTHLTRHLLAALVTTAALLVPAAPALAASDDGGFSVAPMIFDETVTPGTPETYTLTITNADDTSTRYTFSKEDYEGDKDEPAATPVLLGGKFNSPISGYDWIDLPDAITIPGGEARTIKVTVRPPAGAKGGHYAALIVNGNTRRSGQLTATSRIGVLFMLNAGGVPPPDIVITEIKEVGETTTQTIIKYTNNGGTHVTPTPIRKDEDAVTNETLDKDTGTCTTALPHSTGTCTIEDDDKDPNGGTVGDGGTPNSGFVKPSISLIPDGEDGSASSAKGELPTEWAGTWTSMLLPLVGIALFVLYFLFLRRRRKDEEDEGADVLAMP